MPPTTSTRRLNSQLAMQLLLLTGATAVLVEKVGLEGNATYGNVQGSNATVFTCHYRLQAGETLDEVVWVLGGRLVHSYSPTESSPAGTEVFDVSKFELSQVRRTSAGIYSCTVRTKEGADSTGKYEFFVTDIPEPVFEFSSSTSKCVYNISLKTPATFPSMTAFCGVWVNMTSQSGQLGYWLEPPPEWADTNDVLLDDVDVGSLQTRPKLSFSTERGEFSKILYDDERTGFRLMGGTISVDDTPEDSFIKCFTGFYRKSGTFLPSNTIESYSTDTATTKCSNSSLQQFTTQHVTMECSNCVDACRGDLESVSLSRPLTATLRCSKTLEFRTLVCRQSTWTPEVEGDNNKGTFQHDLLDFAEACEKAEGVPGQGTNEGKGGARCTYAGAVAVLLALSCVSLQLRPLM